MPSFSSCLAMREFPVLPRPHPQVTTLPFVMLLFLDFDGVLHPETEGRAATEEEAFCHLPRLESILREYPSANVVITSMWRYDRTLDQLRSHFSADVRSRIIGVTSTIARNNGTYVKALRELEIRHWLADHRCNESWLAIDDKPWLFASAERVICCKSYRGFDEYAAQVLRAKLRQLSDGQESNQS